MIAGAALMDGAILVVSVPEYAERMAMPQTKEHLLLARQAYVTSLVCFLNKVDEAHPDDVALVEEYLRELLSIYTFPAKAIPIIKGSALSALQGTNDEIGRQAILKLMDAVDEYIPDPVRQLHPIHSFLMPIQRVFSCEDVNENEIVVTGRVEKGTISVVGEAVEIMGLTQPLEARVIRMGRLKDGISKGEAGDIVDLGLKMCTGKMGDVQRGQVVAKPGSLKTYKKFEAAIYVLTEDEGGRHTAFVNNDSAQFYFRTAEVTGRFELREGAMVMPGDNVYMTITFELVSPVPLEPGQRFAFREGGRTVGAGVVLEVLSSRCHRWI